MQDIPPYHMQQQADQDAIQRAQEAQRIQQELHEQRLEAEKIRREQQEAMEQAAADQANRRGWFSLGN